MDLGGSADAGIKYKGRNDMALVVNESGSLPLEFLQRM